MTDALIEALPRHESRETLLVKSIEVASFMCHHDMSQAEAIDIVGIAADHLIPIDRSTTSVHWLPTPSEIESCKMQIQSGEVVFNHRGAAVWAEKRAAEKLTRETETAIAGNDFDLAGTLPDDAMKMPSWFRGELETFPHFPA